MKTTSSPFKHLLNTRVKVCSPLRITVSLDLCLLTYDELDATRCSKCTILFIGPGGLLLWRCLRVLCWRVFIASRSDLFYSHLVFWPGADGCFSSYYCSTTARLLIYCSLVIHFWSGYRFRASITSPAGLFFCVAYLWAVHFYFWSHAPQNGAWCGRFIFLRCCIVGKSAALAACSHCVVTRRISKGQDVLGRRGKGVVFDRLEIGAGIWDLEDEGFVSSLLQQVFDTG
jgi:hypothetical protein